MEAGWAEGEVVWWWVARRLWLFLWGTLKLGWPFQGVPQTRQGAESLDPLGRGITSKAAPSVNGNSWGERARTTHRTRNLRRAAQHASERLKD